MRIVSGKAKGKKILIPINKKTRPLKDMVRESIFNILKHSNLLKKDFKNCFVLDLFSGIGSFGIEAISRDAERVVFFEDYKPAVNLLIKNLNNLGFIDKSEVYIKNIYNPNSFRKLSYKFDIIFLDPPFKDDNIKKLLDLLFNSNNLNSKTLIIIHRNRKSLDEFQKNFKVAREETYGSSKIIFGYFIF